MKKNIYKLAQKIFPICRSLSGDGVRETLEILNEIHPMTIYEIPTGTQVFDWTIPKEWNIKNAYVKDKNGNKIIDFKDNNLHVVGYSSPIDKVVSLEELQKSLYSLAGQPNSIPYVTSYYKERYGFCISENQRSKLGQGDYHIFIDSELKDGHLTYGEIIIKGETDEEIFLSTYICHPSMANNEVSGPCIAIYLADFISKIKSRRYTYRIIFIPETIGSIAYLSKNIDYMKKNVISGFNISCVGDDRTYSYIASRYGNTLSDKVAKNILNFHYPDYKCYSFLERGSDERQYNAPGVDLPVCGICRSKYGEYPEYHTSDDNLNLISQSGLNGAFDVYKKCILALENNYFYKVNFLCEPQLGKRGLYPTESYKGSADEVRSMMDFIAYADGSNDLVDISNIIGVPVDELVPIVQKLFDNKLIDKLSN